MIPYYTYANNCADEGAANPPEAPPPTLGMKMMSFQVVCKDSYLPDLSSTHSSHTVRALVLSPSLLRVHASPSLMLARMFKHLSTRPKLRVSEDAGHVAATELGGVTSAKLQAELASEGGGGVQKPHEA